MPGFIIHLAEATMIMDYMERKPDSAWRQEFLLGSLLPDTKLGADKAVSHFWGPEHNEYIARAPELTSFLDKYGHRLDEPGILGYYAHLYLDEHYVNGYWPRILTFEDADGHPEPRKERIDRVELKHSGKVIPFNQFFSSEYYYGDYTRSNHWFVERYHIQAPEYRSLSGLNMDEVRSEDLKKILEELNYLCDKGKMGDEKDLKVFELTELETFALRTAESFLSHMKHLIHI
ncbi:MAG: hypothetical protein EOM34_01885 [Clostridia bacterium]|nr:hypothetical protein [Lachnospiraceae bacterium]NCB99410.1 hypothetical protein [Clostridia bacterium]NCD01487.1 hypothetical protein [Clostridia bacterium]